MCVVLPSHRPLSYRARLGRIDLRLVAYRPRLDPLPEGCVRVVVQVVENGQPLAESPIHEEVMTLLDLARSLHFSLFEGWELTPWPMEQESVRLAHVA